MKNIIFILLASIFLTACSLPFLSKQQAALQVNASPQSTVFLNGNHVGQAPFYDKNLKPGEYTVKIQLDSDPNQTWDTNVTLNSKVVTVLSRTFADIPDQSSNYLIQMEEIADESGTEVSIVTTPDNVIVKLDGQPEGFSPISLKDLSAGSHSLTLSAPGYAEQTIGIQVEPGFKMIISSSLGKSQALAEPEEFQDKDATPSAELEADNQDSEEKPKTSPTPSPTNKPATDEDEDQDDSDTDSSKLERPYVIILETGTGWLRVRSEPNAYQDNEVAKIDVGESFKFIESDDTGWYLIEYEPGEEGWISGKYADIFK